HLFSPALVIEVVELNPRPHRAAATELMPLELWAQTIGADRRHWEPDVATVHTALHPILVVLEEGPKGLRELVVQVRERLQVFAHLYPFLRITAPQSVPPVPSPEHRTVSSC